MECAAEYILNKEYSLISMQGEGSCSYSDFRPQSTVVKLDKNRP